MTGCRLCIAVLCGLPASGKTSVTRVLASTGTDVSSDWHSEKPEGHIRFIVVEYDKLLPADVEKQLIEEETGTSDYHHQSPWKQYRSDVYQCIDALIEKLKNDESPDLSALQNLPGVTGEVCVRFQEHVLTQLHHGITSGCQRLCLLIDDNMYYSSMRYRFFQMARKYSLGYCQIYVYCDVQEAITRNSVRASPVLEEVIVTMATKFEAPDAVNNTWEKFSHSTSLDNICLQDIMCLVQQALDNPVMPLEEVDEELQNQSREICSANFLHQSDQILRRLVSQEMASAKDKTLTKSDMKCFASQMQSKRKEVLDGLKSGQTTVPTSLLQLATDSSKHTDSAVFEFVHSLFSHHQDVT